MRFLVLCYKLLYGGVGLITWFPGGQRQSTESNRKPHEVYVLRMQFLKTVSGSQKSGVGDTVTGPGGTGAGPVVPGTGHGAPNQSCASHSKSSKTAFAKPILREVSDGFLYSATDPPGNQVIKPNPPYSNLQYNTRESAL